MPRASRVKSESGIYHIMLRGINQQVIFEQSEDYEKFTEILNKYKAISGYKVFAYCLMSNHIHLVIKEEKQNTRENTRGRFYCAVRKHKGTVLLKTQGDGSIVRLYISHNCKRNPCQSAYLPY